MFLRIIWINHTDSLIPMILCFWQQCSPHREALQVNTEEKLAQGQDKITAIIDSMCVSGVWSVKSMTDDFQHGGFLSAQMAAV